VVAVGRREVIVFAATHLYLQNLISYIMETSINKLSDCNNKTSVFHSVSIRLILHNRNPKGKHK
jgi:hypothetical protein